jgi:hypothetical protein
VLQLLTAARVGPAPPGPPRPGSPAFDPWHFAHRKGRGGRLVVLAVLSLLSACVEPSSDPSADARWSDVLPAAVHEFVPPEELGVPNRILVAGDLIFVSDPVADTLLHVFSSSDGRKLGSVLPRGQGPGEALGVFQLDHDPLGVRVFDLQQQRSLVLHDVSAELDPASIRVEVVAFRLPFPIQAPVQLDSGELVATGFFAEGRLAFLSRAGEPSTFRGPVPGRDLEMEPFFAQQVYVGTLRYLPARRRLVVANRHADLIEIYDEAGESQGILRGPLGFEPRFTVVRELEGDVASSGQDLRFGYVDLALTPCWLVGLYSGASRQEAPGEASMGRELHLFSWDGVDRIRVPLDAVLLGVAVNPLSGMIYGTRPHPLPGVLRIELPEDLASTLRNESAGC